MGSQPRLHEYGTDSRAGDSKGVGDAHDSQAKLFHLGFDLLRNSVKGIGIGCPTQKTFPKHYREIYPNRRDECKVGSKEEEHKVNSLKNGRNPDPLDGEYRDGRTADKDTNLIP